MTRPPIHDAYLQIHDATLDDLLSALRRHDLDDCRRLLATWSTEGQDYRYGDEDDDHDWDDGPDFSVRFLDHDLTGWVHREAVLHVEAGRFEHALCLVEPYRRPFKVADQHDRIHYATEPK